MTRLGYFGKLPAHGDFVKHCDNHALVQLLDAWLAQVMNALTAAPRWKRHYDAMAPLRFAFVGLHSRHGIAGRIEASCDQSQRRFPFMVMSALAIGDPAAFAPCSALALAPLWQRIGQLADGVTACADPSAALLALAREDIALAPDDLAHAAQLADFLRSHTIGRLQSMLAMPALPDAPATLRELLLALGLLLRPVRRSGRAHLEKSLLLPLPAQAHLQALVASFWLHLIAPCLAAQPFELALFFATHQGAPVLAIGFGGADPLLLQALIDTQSGSERLIVLDRLDWLAPQLEQQPGLRQLSACLQQPQLSLQAACALFFDAFV